MIRTRALSLLAIFLLAAAPAAGLAESGDTDRGGGVTANVIYGLTEDGRLVSFAPGAPQTLLSNVEITGLAPGEQLLAIDFRPNGEQLYGLSDANRIFVINVQTGAATPVGSGFSAALVGSSFGFDFNPTVDRIRVVSDSEQNLRLNPDTGATASIDLPLAYAANDVNAGVNPNAVGAAYANNFPGATTTTLYVIDSVADVLAIQNPPNDGVLNTVGLLGVDTTDLVGFDIASRSGIAYAALNLTGETISRLYTINLGTGAATQVGPIGGTSRIIGIAIPINILQGADTVGVYNPANAGWFLRNSNTSGPADITFVYGTGGALVPIVGDWDGDGDTTPGVYDPATSTFFLRNSNSAGPADITAFTFGTGGTGLVPLAGDWNGDGVDTIGVYNPATGAFFLRNQNSSGPSNFAFVFGPGGMGLVPITGDWNGDGVDTIGVYNPAAGTFFLKNTNAPGPADLTFFYGPAGAGAVPVVGDFDNNTTDTVGVYIPSTGAFFLRNSNTAGAADLTFFYGTPGLVPLVGDWDNV